MKKQSMKEKLLAVVRAQLVQGAHPRGLAMACAVAFICATFPLIGTTTLMCVACGIIWRLNQPVMIALNYLLTPVHLILIPIFLWAGEAILGRPHLSLNPVTVVDQFFVDWRLFLSQYGTAGLHAILAWSIFSPIAGVLIYFVTHRIFLRLDRDS